MIYLDNNATTQIDRRVAELMLDVWQSGPLNASSQHAAGRWARNRLDDAVSQLGQLLGADVDSPGGDSLVLTSGGTEANNLAICGIGDSSLPLVVSASEHPSVLLCARKQMAAGREVHVIPVDSSGVINLQAAAELITHTAPRPSLVSVMAANNETGVLQPIEQLAAICQDAGVPLHVDATQSVGKLAVDFRRLNVAALTASAHKFHGPAGIGLLLVRSGTAVRPLMYGGEQQLGKRPGTEAVALAVAMTEALRIAIESRDQSIVTMNACLEHLETTLLGEFPEIVIHGSGVARLPGTSCISFPRSERQTMLMALDVAGVCCSSGSACASGSSQPSHVLMAMGVARPLVDTALRFGFSRLSTPEESHQATAAISRCYGRLGQKKAVEKSA
jgi:cysteine desulfurase